MAFSFPSSPSTGTLFTAPSGVMYVWDGSWTTMGDTQASNPFSNSFLYRSIYTKGYMNGGYKNSSPWRNVNKTIHSTDMTTNLGDKLVYNSSYVGGGFSDYNSYIYPSTGAVGGSGTIVESMNMANETMFSLDSARYLKSTRSDCEALMTPALTAAYIVGGGTTAVDRHNFTTDVMFSAGTAPASPLAGGTAGGLGSLFGRFKAWISQGAGSSFTWATETWATGGMSWGTDGQPKGLSSKHGHGYGGVGSYSGSSYVYKFSEATGSNLATVNRAKNNGEENWQIGQNWGYMLGAYDAAPLGQNNDAERINYLTDTYTQLGSDTQPKGHDGASSGSCATGSAAFVGY
jgi:hypothetical protein